MEHSLVEKFSALILTDKRDSIPTIFTAILTTSKSYEEKWENRLSKIACKELMMLASSTSASF